MKDEEWMQVEGWPYSVSDQGRVRNDRTGHVLRPAKHNCGYRHVALCEGKKRRRAYVHHLVLEAFVSPRPEGEETNHKNGNKADNRLANLEWVTRSANASHAARTGLRDYSSITGVGCWKAKLTPRSVREIRDRYANTDVSSYTLAREYGVSPRAVRMAIHGETWAHVEETP